MMCCRLLSVNRDVKREVIALSFWHLLLLSLFFLGNIASNAQCKTHADSYIMNNFKGRY